MQPRPNDLIVLVLPFVRDHYYCLVVPTVTCSCTTVKGSTSSSSSTLENVYNTIFDRDKVSKTLSKSIEKWRLIAVVKSNHNTTIMLLEYYYSICHNGFHSLTLRVFIVQLSTTSCSGNRNNIHSSRVSSELRRCHRPKNFYRYCKLSCLIVPCFATGKAKDPCELSIGSPPCEFWARYLALCLMNECCPSDVRVRSHGRTAPETHDLVTQSHSRHPPICKLKGPPEYGKQSKVLHRVSGMPEPSQSGRPAMPMRHRQEYDCHQAIPFVPRRSICRLLSDHWLHADTTLSDRNCICESRPWGGRPVPRRGSESHTVDHHPVARLAGGWRKWNE